MTRLSYRILIARKKKGILQKDIAHQIGVTRAAVSKWEKGLTEPSVENLMKIAEILGVSVSWLIECEENEKCNCAERKDPVTARGGEIMREKNQKLREENDALKHDHEEKQICDMEHQRERLKKADEHVIEAISKANTALEKLEQLLVENDLRRDEVIEIAQSITTVGDTIAKLRQSMNTNTPFYGFAV